CCCCVFFFQAEDGIRDRNVTGVQTLCSSDLFQLGLDIAEIKEQNPQAVGCILGGHGITAWGDTSEAAENNSLWIIDTAEKYIIEIGRASCRERVDSAVGGSRREREEGE